MTIELFTRAARRHSSVWLQARSAPDRARFSSRPPVPVAIARPDGPSAGIRDGVDSFALASPAVPSSSARRRRATTICRS
jgi:hypothetical protein